MVVDTTLYDLLNVDPSATEAELKKAYRKASLANHPDKNPGNEEAHSRFQEINAAYETLSDPDTRAAYDRYGPEQPGGGGGGGAPDMDDIFAQMFGMGGGMPGMGGMGGGPRPKPRRGQDSIIDYDVTLSDLYNGRTAHFNLSKQIICPTCSGSGGKPGTQPKTCVKCDGKGKCLQMRSMGNGMVSQSYAMCNQCNGEGSKVRDKDQCKKCKGNKTIKTRSKLELKIAKGMLDGQTIEFAGENDEEPGVPEAGSIIFRLSLREDSNNNQFQLKGLDLFTKVHITLQESLLGFDRIVLIHLDGTPIKVSKRPGKVTTPNSVDKLVGLGMPRENDLGERGDLFIQWQVDFPQDDWLDDNLILQDQLRNILPSTPKSDTSIQQDGNAKVLEPLVRQSRLDQWGNNQPHRKQQDDFWQDETEAPQAGCASS
ncbi:unnamed protein product [Sympodiomycopsis kandeliae]